jgi:hypothetical protein
MYFILGIYCIKIKQTEREASKEIMMRLPDKFLEQVRVRIDARKNLYIYFPLQPVILTIKNLLLMDIK